MGEDGASETLLCVQVPLELALRSTTAGAKYLETMDQCHEAAIELTLHKQSPFVACYSAPFSIL